MLDYAGSSSILCKIVIDKNRQKFGVNVARKRYGKRIQTGRNEQRKGVDRTCSICKRLKKLKIKLPLQDIGNDVILAVDSSGMKVSNRGEWMRHKWKVRKGWIKVHIVVDVKTKHLLAFEITDERTGGGTMLKPLVKKAKKTIGNKKIDRIYGDGSYDSRENFNYLEKEGIEPVIKTRKNASHRSARFPGKGQMYKRKKRTWI